MKGFAVVIPCLNEADYIGRCIASLLNQDLRDIDIEVIVVDGMSDDGTRDIVDGLARKDARIRCIDNPARVTPTALNLGIRAAGAEAVAILGGHAEVMPDFARRNMAALDAHPDAGCVGGVIENVCENETARVIALAMKSPFGVGNARFRTGGRAGYVDTVAFGTYRRSVFDEIGFFDERLVRNQDDEFNFRLTSAGYRVWFDPEIRSKYYVRGAFGKLARQYRQYGYWKVFVNKIHGTVTTVRQLVPFFFASFLFVGAAGAAFSPEVRGAWIAGILLWLAAACAAGLHAGSTLRGLPSMVTAFFILHFYYGVGYARGIVDFLLLGKKPNTRRPDITR